MAKWLKSHKVTASASAELSAGDAGSHLDAIASESGIDIIVAGAYGHSRLREWVFGGGHPPSFAAQSNVCVFDALNPRCQSLFDLNQTADARLRIVFRRGRKLGFRRHKCDDGRHDVRRSSWAY